ncbi:hypothetical protein [Changpingibacter yushuensis]|uniref:hypothetical protein n=1 Tax=Changpingibacter yushuensis TaxID=2758440 RepID=UPI00165DCF9A|nr:hypothetical protein [Changpingibacter yushuensis]
MVKKIQLTTQESNQILDEVQETGWTQENYAKYFGLEMSQVTQEMVHLANELNL